MKEGASITFAKDLGEELSPQGPSKNKQSGAIWILGATSIQRAGSAEEKAQFQCPDS